METNSKEPVLLGNTFVKFITKRFFLGWGGAWPGKLKGGGLYVNEAHLISFFFLCKPSHIRNEIIIQN